MSPQLAVLQLISDSGRGGRELLRASGSPLMGCTTGWASCITSGVEIFGVTPRASRASAVFQQILAGAACTDRGGNFVDKCRNGYRTRTF
jgi:hypothetical protein